VAASALAAKHHRAVCVLFRCKTLLADTQVRVYQATSRHPREEAHDSTFAEWVPTGHVTPLGDELRFEGPSLEGLALSGRFVAYALGLTAERYPGTGTTWAIGRLNVQTGRRERVPTDGEKGGGFGEKSPGVTDVAVTAAGTVAWIDDGSFANPLPGTPNVLPLGSRAVFELAPGSKMPTPLAVSATIEPKSLAAIPGRLYWTEGGAARSTPVP
jgi:hypothetical protein